MTFLKDNQNKNVTQQQIEQSINQRRQELRLGVVTMLMCRTTKQCDLGKRKTRGHRCKNSRT